MCWRTSRNQPSIWRSLLVLSILVFRPSASAFSGSSDSASCTFCRASGHSSSSRRVRALSSNCCTRFWRDARRRFGGEPATSAGPGVLLRPARPGFRTRIDNRLARRLSWRVQRGGGCGRDRKTRWARRGRPSADESANSRAVENRCQGCLAMALWTTRLMAWFTFGSRSDDGGRSFVHDRFDDLALGGALKRTASREHLIGHHAQREDVGKRRRRLHFQQLRRHEQQRPFLPDGVRRRWSCARRRSR